MLTYELADKDKVYHAMVVANFFRNQVLDSDSDYPGLYQVCMLEGLRMQEYLAEQVSQSLAEIPLYVEAKGNIPKMKIPATLMGTTGNLTGMPKPGTFNSSASGISEDVSTVRLGNLPPQLQRAFDINANNVLGDLEASLNVAAGNYSGFRSLGSISSLLGSLGGPDGGIVGAALNSFGKKDVATSMRSLLESVDKTFMATLAAGKVIPTAVGLQEMAAVSHPIINFATRVLLQGDPTNKYATFLDSCQISMVRLAEEMSKDAAKAMDAVGKMCKNSAQLCDQMGNASVLNNGCSAVSAGQGEYGISGPLPFGGSYSCGLNGASATIAPKIPKCGQDVLDIGERVATKYPKFNSCLNTLRWGFQDYQIPVGGYGNGNI